jgi:hypothetical protein
MSVGKVSGKPDAENMVHYKISNRKHLKSYLIPIFDSYQLKSSKQHHYLLFKEALIIAETESLDEGQKIDQIDELKEDIKNKPTFYGPISVLPQSNQPITEDWMIGFIEAEGSFYITKKDEGRLTHAFGITQKIDPHLLQHIKRFFTVHKKVK